MSKPAIPLLIGATLLAGCTAIGDALGPPKLTPISNPATVAGASRVSMPLPAPRNEAAGANSLWRTGAKSFFGDQRAVNIGDILTINIEIADSAQVNNTTATSRTSSAENNLTALLGFEQTLKKALPGDPSLSPAIGFDSKTDLNGTGSVNRAEQVKLTLAATITDKLPNGNLVLGGSQEVRVNNELRELLISGVIRPEDIAADNTIPYTKIAEARISYGGRGDISQVQRDKYGKRIYDKIVPF